MTPIISIGADSRGVFASVAVWPPARCGCGRAAATFINRHGSTRCVECDVKTSPTTTESNQP